MDFSHVLRFRADGNKAYPLKLGSLVLPVYCHMTDDLGACGGGGWTLAMKIDGNKVLNVSLTKTVALSIVIISFSHQFVR